LRLKPVFTDLNKPAQRSESRQVLSRRKWKAVAHFQLQESYLFIPHPSGAAQHGFDRRFRPHPLAEVVRFYKNASYRVKNKAWRM
jgi:hypothetical protein